ncbi:MAG: hypothetical protein PHF40_00340 [Candidatus Pacebacteria bacterium]|nr:hypothetical protein [Candidatus Paceibacterota bacterium]
MEPERSIRKILILIGESTTWKVPGSCAKDVLKEFMEWRMKMKPEIEEIRFRIGNFLVFFISVPTKNGKKQPRLKYWVKDGAIIQDPAESKKDIPSQALREAYARAAIIFNKF